jgi:hypothetical protein
MCDVQLPPGVNPTAVKYTYHISYHIMKTIPYEEEFVKINISADGIVNRLGARSQR